MNTNSHTERYTQLINLYLILPSGELSSLTSIYIDSSTGIICNPPSISSSNKIKDIKIIDLNGKMISPGLIDIQINGAFGVDLSEFENTQKYIEGLKKMSKRLCEFGITSFLPTIISQKNQKYQSILPILKQVTNLLFDKSDEMARSLGWHLEGPFINPCKSGCHPTINFVNASNGIKSLKEMYGDDNLKKNEKMIKMITLAPEIKGILDVMPFLVRMNGKLAWVIPFEGISKGATLITHLFNAMPYMHHLEPGIIGLLGLPDHPCAQAAMRPSMPHKFCSEFPTPKKEGQKPTPYLVPGQNLDPEKDWLNVEFMAKKDESKNVMNFEQQLEELSMQAVYDLNGTPSLLDSSTKLSSEIDHINTPSDSIKEIGKQTAQVERPYFSIIADGIHVHPQIVSMAYNAHPEGCILISDAMHMLDPSLPDSTYPWRDGSIEKRDGGITLAGTNTLAGSILPLCDAITNLSKFADIPLSKAIVCATYTPAKALGGEIERKVGLSIGCWADLCIWDEKGLKGVWKGGKEVWHVA